MPIELCTVKPHAAPAAEPEGQTVIHRGCALTLLSAINWEGLLYDNDSSLFGRALPA